MRMAGMSDRVTVRVLALVQVLGGLMVISSGIIGQVKGLQIECGFALAIGCGYFFLLLSQVAFLQLRITKLEERLPPQSR